MVGHLVQLNSKATVDHFSQGYNGSGWLLKATYHRVGTVGIYFPTYANCGAVVEGNLSSGWYSRDINEFPAYANCGSVVYQSAAHLSHVNKKSECRLVVRVTSGM